MPIGMGVSDGNNDKKRELAADLDVVAAKARELDLWVDGKPFYHVLKAVSNQLYELVLHEGADSVKSLEERDRR